MGRPDGRAPDRASKRTSGTLTAPGKAEPGSVAGTLAPWEMRDTPDDENRTTVPCRQNVRRSPFRLVGIELPSPSESAPPAPSWISAPHVEESDLSVFDLENLDSALPVAPTPATDPLAMTTVSPWPEPFELGQLLSQADRATVPLSAWADQIRAVVKRLGKISRFTSDESERAIDQLAALAEQATLVERQVAPEEETLVRQIAYAVQKRADVWRASVAFARAQQESHSVPQPVKVEQILPILERMNRTLAATENGRTWQTYLRLDDIRQVATRPWITDPTVRREIARDVLYRLRNPLLDDNQRRFLQNADVQALAEQLETWAIQRLDAARIVHTLEQFEQVRSAPIAAQVATQIEALRYVPLPEAATLFHVLETHYRNANFRFALSEELINQLLPALEPTEEPVRTEMLGARVSGHNNTWTRLYVELIEDPERIHLRLLAKGTTQLETVSRKGPVRLYSEGTSHFRADKQLLISPQGIVVGPAVANAKGGSRLVDVKTDYDRVPLIGWIVKQIAIDEHREYRPLLRARLRNRIRQTATQRLDDSLQSRVTGAGQKVRQAVLDPLGKKGLDPCAIEMRTTTDRIILRGRIASHTQLAAYTPRPRARADSVLSLQIHESTVNNLVQRLPINGQEIGLADLVDRMASRLGIDREDIHEDIPEGIVLRLATDVPVQFQFQQGHLLVTIRLSELRTERRTWHNLTVRGRYRASVENMDVDLTREGGIELISEAVGFRDQLALRGIFTKVMTRNHRLSIVQGRLESDPRLQDLTATQFIVRDGWIGVSIGHSDSASSDARLTRNTRLRQGG